MGKSWKFMASSKERPKVHKVRPEYQWSTQAFTLKEIVSSFRLPTIVLCNVESCTVLWSNFYFELKQPLLLYSRQQAKKACAWCLKKNQETGRYSQFGPPVVIPEDYDGWFQLIHGENDRPFQFNSIEAIATSFSDNFLCATESQGFIVRVKPDESLQFIQRSIAAGEILKKISIYTGDVTKEIGGKTELVEMKYLKCTDEKNEELVIPFDQKGKFYAVSYNISYDSGLVQVREIVRKSNKLPVFAQHIYGDPPALSYNYTGQLQFYDCMQEETAMAATLTKDRVRPLELQMDSPIRFRIALNEAQVRPRSEFIKAMELCQGLGQKYIRDMKIAFTLKPASTSLDDIDLSLYNMNEDSLRQSNSLEIESDLGEAIDANSEFEIDWGPPMQEEKKTDEEKLGSESHVCCDENGYYVDDINAALDGEESDIPSDDETKDSPLIISHGRLENQGKSRNCYDIESDGSEDTDIFYDDEYLETCMTMDDDPNGSSKTTGSISDENETCPQHIQNNIDRDYGNQIHESNPSVDGHEDGILFQNCTDGSTEVENITDEPKMTKCRDDTGYDSDQHDGCFSNTTYFVYENGEDSEATDNRQLSTFVEMEKNLSAKGAQANKISISSQPGSKDLYDTIEHGGLVIVDGSAHSDNDRSLFQYDWGDEYV
ncbi:hypothetical protein ScPMuIL_000425 [Solemya velum]